MVQDFKDVFNLRTGIHFLANFAIAIQMIVSKVENILKGILDSIPSKHKEALRTLVESLVQMTCSDFTNFLKTVESALLMLIIDN